VTRRIFLNASFRESLTGPGKGRPIGSRNKFGEGFTAAFYEDFLEHGAAAIVRLRKESIRDYIRAAVALVPKELNITKQSTEDFSDDDLLTILDSMRQQLIERNRPEIELKADEG
jgi:hypothetical protein